MKKSNVLFLGCFMLFGVASAFGGEVIKIGGGGAACQGFVLPMAEPFETEMGIRLEVNPSNPAQGLMDLDAGRIDLAVAGVPLDFMIKTATSSGTKIDPAAFVVREIGVNQTMVFLHRGNNVKKLGKQQLQDIFTGKISNWAKLGGPNLPIKVVWGTGTPGQNELFARQILSGKQVTRKHLVASDYKHIKDLVAKTPGAIGIDPQGFVSMVTRNPQIPMISSPVIAVTKGKPSAEVDKLIEYMKSYSWL